MSIREPGGRLGDPIVRNQNAAIADELENRGWSVIRGGGYGRTEEYMRPVAGGRKGAAYPDITAVKNGRVLRINTATTTTPGGSFTAEELRNAAKIRGLQKPGEHLLVIGKNRIQ